MSPELVGAFERQWPEVSNRLQGLLASKHVPSCKREDVVQETGLRLFGMWEKVDRNRPVWPLAVTIALNLMRDEARRNSQREILGAVPEMPAAHDVEDEGLARIELERVQHALAQLSPSHRNVLLDEITPHPEVPKPARNATKMMRLRARRALTTLLETAVIRAGVMGLKIRQSLGSNDPLLPLRMGAGETAGAPATAFALAAILFGSVTVQPAPVANASERPHRVIQSSTGDAQSDGLDAGSNSFVAGDLMNVQRAVRAAKMDARHARMFGDDGHRAWKAGARGKHGNNKGGRHGKRSPGWGAPPPEESAPIEIPLPIGSIHAGAGAGVGSVGAEVGDRQGNPAPVCLAGVEPGGLGCGTEPAEKVRVVAGGETEVNGQKVDVEVKKEISTDID